MELLINKISDDFINDIKIKGSRSTTSPTPPGRRSPGSPTLGRRRMARRRISTHIVKESKDNIVTNHTEGNPADQRDQGCGGHGCGWDGGVAQQGCKGGHGGAGGGEGQVIPHV